MNPRQSPAGSRSSDGRLLALALGIGAVVLVLGRSIESAVISALHPSGHGLEWISDVLAAIAVSALSYLWLHLRAARSRVLDLERAQIAVDAQLRVAAEIQRSLLPTVPQETRGFRWATSMVAALQVGGDFYDFREGSDGSVLAVLGDVSGKGVPAALLQSSLKTLFRIHSVATADPAEIAERMSADLYGETGGTPYATAIVARFEMAPRRLIAVNAGHPAGLLIRGESRIELDAGGPPLGILAGSRYERSVTELRTGDLGVLVTEGITEALEGVPTSLAEVLREKFRHGGTPQEVCVYLMTLAAAAPGPPGAGEWQDDRTVFAFSVEQDPREHLRSGRRPTDDGTQLSRPGIAPADARPARGSGREL